MKIGVEINLTKMEGMLLGLLIDNSFCSYDLISKEVYKCNNDIYTNAAIKQLKAKLTYKTGIRIEVVRSAGYRLKTNEQFKKY